MINKEKVHINLNQKLPVIVFNSTDSTNTQARRILSSKHSERMLIVANEQTNGRGRLGRSFYSPADTGIYMTYSFYTEKTCNNIARITTAASVAVAKALNCDAKIKWVNDLYCNDRKICGILTESFSSAMGKGLYVLVGIGVNLTTESFPDDIKMIAGSVNKNFDKELLIAKICDNLSQIIDNFSCTDYLDYYRENMMGIGETVCYRENGKLHQAVILGIDNSGGLIVKENNEEKILYSAEITFSGYQAGERTEWK